MASFVRLARGRKERELITIYRYSSKEKVK